MDLGIAGQHALVMGGSRGLGRAIAGALAGEGAHVSIAARGSDSLDLAAQELGARPYQAAFDDPGAVRDLMTTVLRDAGHLDILVVNSGGPPKSSLLEATAADWQQAFASLWLSATEAVRAALPGMVARRHGRILFVTSVAAVEPEAGLIFSNGLRAGLHGLVNAVSKEVAASGVTVNALMPGYMQTQRIIDLGADFSEMKQRIPAGRYGEPAEFAALAAFLASRQAAYITGQAIACDGGLLRSI